MADPLTALKVIGAAAGGLAGRSAAMQEEAQMKLNAKLAETQALQRDTLARDELYRAESADRAARGANNLSANSPNAAILFKERRGASDRDRLIQRADDRQRAANFRSAARAASSRGKWSMATGLVNGGISLAEYGSYKGWGK